jgi:hypothetical protein
MFQSMVALALALALAGQTGPPVGGYNVPRGVRQLFLDDAGVEDIAGLRRVVNRPQRCPDNPVILGENPWELASVSVYGTSMYDAQRRRFRMWYLCTPGPNRSGRSWVEVGGYRRVAGCTLLAYAESTDGVHWIKPTLNELSFEGSRRNNLVDIGIDNPEGVSILCDPHDPDPDRRYKALFWDRRLVPPNNPHGVDAAAARVPKSRPGLTQTEAAGGMWVAFSPDGIRWRTHGPVLAYGSDTTQTLLYDPATGRYVAFVRAWIRTFGRAVARTESPDCLRWTQPALVLSTDTADGPSAQIYGMPTDLYEGVYLGMLWMYREGADGKIDTQLAASRDGLRWTRVADRQTFLATGPPGSRDDGMARVVGRLIARGDTLYLYYSMVNGPHRGPKFPDPVRKFPTAIGLATLRRDGFVSLDAGDAGGSVLTKPFLLPGSRLRANVDARGGELRATLCDSDGRAIPGFERSLQVSADAPHALLRWRGARVDALRGRTVRIRITLRHAKLYSWWVE